MLGRLIYSYYRTMYLRLFLTSAHPFSRLAARVYDCPAIPAATLNSCL